MKWISVEDRLPEFGKKVLVLIDRTYHINPTDEDLIEVATLFGEECEAGRVWREYGWYNYDLHQSFIEDVTHWMPLPEVPK
jgi:hypothetical protein